MLPDESVVIGRPSPAQVSVRPAKILCGGDQRPFLKIECHNDVGGVIQAASEPDESANSAHTRCSAPRPSRASRGYAKSNEPGGIGSIPPGERAITRRRRPTNWLMSLGKTFPATNIVSPFATTDGARNAMVSGRSRRADQLLQAIACPRA